MGDGLVPIQVGSYVLQIIDYAVPAASNGEVGELKFIWGDQSWSSFGEGNPCAKQPAASDSEATYVSCNYQCDS